MTHSRSNKTGTEINVMMDLVSDPELISSSSNCTEILSLQTKSKLRMCSQRDSSCILCDNVRMRQREKYGPLYIWLNYSLLYRLMCFLFTANRIGTISFSFISFSVYVMYVAFISTLTLTFPFSIHQFDFRGFVVISVRYFFVPFRADEYRIYDTEHCKFNIYHSDHWKKKTLFPKCSSILVTKCPLHMCSIF